MRKRDKTRWDRRERKKAKLKNGMQIDGRSILIIQDIINKRAIITKRPNSGKRAIDGKRPNRTKRVYRIRDPH